MNDKCFLGVLLVGALLIGLVSAAEVDSERGFWDVVIDFFREIFSTFTGQAIIGVSPIPSTGEWWNSSWHYRVGVEAQMNGYSREDWPLEVYVNFSDELDGVGDFADFDVDSIRVVEYNSSGYALWEVKSDFEMVSGFDADSNAAGSVVLLLNGTTGTSEVRDFLIYFDSVDNPKVATSYSSSIVYNFDGSEISVQNSLLDFTIDTSRGEGTSGLYYAERTDSSTVIFNVGVSEKTVEYMEYYDGSSYYGFDLDGSASLELDGVVKKVILQSGNEVDWDTVSSTGNNVSKRYTVYEDSPWIFIEQVFSNGGNSSVSRRSDGVAALMVDVDRAFGLDNLVGPGGEANDPYSWKSATTSSGYGVGLINYEEQGTSNYYVQGSVFTGLIGVQLDSTTVNVNGSISETAVFYFNDEDNYSLVEDLKNRLENDVVLTLEENEEYVVELNASSDYAIYNLNESVLVRLEVLTDSHNLVDYVNVTLDMGTVSTVDDVVLVLVDDGAHGDGLADDGVYGEWYTVDVSASVGGWNFSAVVYDEYFQEIGNAFSGFEVSDVLNTALTIPVFAGLIGWDVVAYFILENVRNDSYVSGVVSCDYNGTSVSNISEVSTGNYSVDFAAPLVVGTYELVCLGSDSGNSGNDSFVFYVDPDKATLDFDFVPVVEIVSGVTQADSANFTIDVNISNVDVGRSLDTNVSLVMPSGNFVANSSLEGCGSMSSGGTCLRSFFIDILAGTADGNYNISLNVSWINPDSTLDYSVKNLSMVVVANAIFNLSSYVFDKDVSEGEVKSYLNFSVDSIGNTEVFDVNFSCVSGAVCTDFNVSFVPSNFSSISGGSSGDVEIFVGVPEGYDPGNYSGVVNVSSLNAGVFSFDVNASVEDSGTWNISTVSCFDIVLVEDAGSVCEIVLNNSGNIQLNFSILPSGGNYTYVSPQNFSVAKQSNGSFFIEYNTTGAPPQETFILDYVLSANGGDPAFVIVNVSLDVVFGPEIWMSLSTEAEQGSGFLIVANISDRSVSGIDFVRANVTHPGGSVGVINLTNTSVLGIGGYSQWAANYTNNFERGDYVVVVYSEDVAGGTGEDNDSLMIYARLNVSLRSGWEDYLLGESGTIYYSVDDYAGTGLVVDVNVSVRDSDGLVRYYDSFQTNTLGELDILPSFSVPNDAVVGVYNLSAQTGYDDSISGRRISNADEDWFSVYDHLFVSLDTSVTWYPDSVMAFYLLVYSTGLLSAAPTGVDLIVYDPAQAQYTTATLGDFTLVSNSSSSFLYLYKYAMPASSPTGDFLATVDVSEGTRSFQDVQSFRISSGGPFDLILNLSVVDAPRGGVVPFEIIMKNMGEVPQDVYLDYWVADIGGTNYSRVTGEAIFVDAMGNTTISRTLPIFDWQPLGEHILYVTMDYSQVIGPITTSKNFFVIEGNATVDPEPGPGPSGGGSGGGGGGSGVTGEVVVEEEEALVVLDIDPDELEIERGGVVYLMVEMKNNLDWNLIKVAAALTVDDEIIGESGVLDLLPMGEKVVLPVKVAVGVDFDSGFYNGELKIISGDVETRQVYRVNVFDSKDELLLHRKSRLEDRLENLRGRTILADNDGFDVGTIFDSIRRIGLDFDLLNERLKDRKYLESLEYLEQIENDIEETEYELDGIVAVDVSWGWLVWTLTVGVLILLILIILILKWGRIFRKWKFEKLRKRYQKKGARKVRRVVSSGYEKRKAGVKRASEYLKTLEEQYKYGYISKATYDEARKGK